MSGGMVDAGRVPMRGARIVRQQHVHGQSTVQCAHGKMAMGRATWRHGDTTRPRRGGHGEVAVGSGRWALLGEAGRGYC